MTIKYTATPADVGALYSYCWRNSAYFRRRLIFNSVLVGLAIIAIPFFVDGKVGKSDIVIALSVTVAFPFVVPLIAKLRTKKSQRTLSISANGIHTQIGTKTGDIPWARVAELFVTEEHIFLLGRNLNGFCIPRTAFSNAPDREDFIGLCRPYLSARKTSFTGGLRGLVTRGRIICVLLLLFLVFYLRPITALIFAKWQVRNSPEMWIVPTPLPNVPVEQSSVLKCSYFGYQFDVPWTQVKLERKLATIAVLNFANGEFVSFPDPSQNGGELAAMKQEANKGGTDVGKIFGKKAVNSNYDLRSKILYLTPRDLSLFSSRQEMAGNSILLLMKSIWTKRIKGGLYSFETPWIRGFQEGSPAEDDMTIIDGFDAHDREIELWVGSEKGANKPSQADINRILYSLRPDPASPPN
jgi:hypothetical protein